MSGSQITIYYQETKWVIIITSRREKKKEKERHDELSRKACGQLGEIHRAFETSFYIHHVLG